MVKAGWESQRLFIQFHNGMAYLSEGLTQAEAMQYLLEYFGGTIPTITAIIPLTEDSFMLLQDAGHILLGE